MRRIAVAALGAALGAVLVASAMGQAFAEENGPQLAGHSQQAQPGPQDAGGQDAGGQDDCERLLSDDEKKEIDRLVDQLNAEGIEDRDDAERKLREKLRDETTEREKMRDHLRDRAGAPASDEQKARLDGLIKEADQQIEEARERDAWAQYWFMQTCGEDPHRLNRKQFRRNWRQNPAFRERHKRSWQRFIEGR